MAEGTQVVSSLSDLEKMWLVEHAAEQLHRENRRMIEEQMLHHMEKKDEGTVKSGNTTVTYGVTRKIDLAEYNIVREAIPRGLDPVKWEASIDLKKFRSICQANPALEATCRRFITETPKKPSVKVGADV